MARGPDDALHPLLSKAGPVGQTTLDRDDAPRDNLGPRRIREVQVRQALTDFTMGGHASGVAWSLNPYAGCHHACLYCYVPDTMRAERRRWGSYVLVKTNLPRLLADEVDRKEPLTVYMSTGTDPYQAVEAERRLTRRCLEVLARADWPLEVLTRGPLVLRDLDRLHRFSHLRVGMSVPTLDDRARKLMEPSAPAVGARLRTLGRLSEEGLVTFANLSPAYPLTGGLTADAVAGAFRDAGVHWVNTSHWRRRGTILGPIWDRLHDAGPLGEELARFAADRKRQAALREELEAAFDRAGVPLHTGFYNPPFEMAHRRPGHRQARLGEVPMKVEARRRPRRTVDLK